MMALTREPRELVRPCDKCAELHNPSVMRGLEGSVCGWAYRSTSWKTRQEAERIAQLLELLTTAKLLDVGAGTGRPGLHLAEVSGWDVLVVGLPLERLRLALQRAVTESVAPHDTCLLGDRREGSYQVWLLWLSKLVLAAPTPPVASMQRMTMRQMSAIRMSTSALLRSSRKMRRLAACARAVHVGAAGIGR
jgi:hypothetical protein